ncbi:MAG: choline transporter [Gammaproteobacteria bacterium]|nr:choline transporter [Gammaproteobacteria bacterium]
MSSKLLDKAPDVKSSETATSEVNSDLVAAIDPAVFFGSSGLLLAITAVIMLRPESSTLFLNELYIFVTTQVGVLYILTAIFTISFLFWLSCSPHGSRVLGTSEKPHYSTPKWAALLFCSGIGGSLIYWGGTEWVFYYIDPPFGLSPKSDESLKWALAYGLFHWGPIGWSFYCLPAIALGCSHYLEGCPTFRLSEACRPVLKGFTARWPGRVADLSFLFGVIASSATGLGFGIAIVSASTSQLIQIADSSLLQIGIIIVATMLIIFSVYRGLDRGILVLSTVNLYLALLFIGFVFILGPSRFILEMGVVSLGTFVGEFFEMLTWSDPQERNDFVESWTVFYWAWWIALGPFMGMFVARVSEGRTIRQIIGGVIGYGSAGCALFFIVLGNFSVSLQLEGTYSLVTKVGEGISPAVMMSEVISFLPYPKIWLAYLAIIGLIFTATTYDSASYVLASGSSKSFGKSGQPARWLRVFWALSLGALPLTLLYAGGLRELQTASLVGSLPIILLYILMAVSIVRTLKKFQKHGSESHNQSNFLIK